MRGNVFNNTTFTRKFVSHNRPHLITNTYVAFTLLKLVFWPILKCIITQSRIGTTDDQAHKKHDKNAMTNGFIFFSQSKERRRYNRCTRGTRDIATTKSACRPIVARALVAACAFWHRAITT